MRSSQRSSVVSVCAALAAWAALPGCGSDGVVQPDPFFPMEASVPDDASQDAARPSDDAADAAPDAATAARMISWDDNLMDVGGVVGTIHTLRCGPGDLHLVFGTRIYAGHSSICMAAYHSELITMGEGGTFRLRVEPEQGSFTGSLRNGVMSGRWLESAAAFSFPDARAPETP